MADETTKNVYTKQRIVAQDINFGLGTIVQIRNGIRVEGKLVDSSDIPYDSSRSVKDVLDALLAQSGIS
jgi:hypothetical protein